MIVRWENWRNTILGVNYLNSTFEVDCIIQKIEKQENNYFVKIVTEDDRDLSFQIVEEDQELIFKNIYSTFPLWHKEEVLMNVLASILCSEQRRYWDKWIPEKMYIYNRKKLDSEEFDLRYRFIKDLPQIEDWIVQLNNSESTKDTYRWSMRIFLRYCIENGATLNNFGIGDVQGFFKRLEKKKSEYYVEKTYYALLKYIRDNRPELEKFYKDMVIIASPVNLLEQAPKSLSRVKVNEMFRKLEEPLYTAQGKGNQMRYFEALRNLTITHILFDVGLRLSEITNLNMENIELGKTAKSSKLRIIGKGNKIRYLPLGKNSRKWLEEYLSERKLLLEAKEVDVEAVFISNQMKRISTRSIYRIFEKFDTNPHAARHTLLTKLVRNGNDLVTVKEIAGHSNINTTARYSKPTFEELADIIE